jgi:hypothetical protein
MKFIGRKKELKDLEILKDKATASLVVVRGRRRIGKSRLIEEFGKSAKNYIEIAGLGPKEGGNNASQLEHFSTKLSIQTNSRQKIFSNWTEALFELVQATTKGEWIILLDEISWLGRFDPLFPEKIKDAWDTGFKKNDKLILVLCGSVSSWIEKEIVMNKSFEGRVSLDLTLNELTIPEINQFWKSVKTQHMGSFEKMMILSVTGGIPKYLEEVLSKNSAEKNLVRLCFEKSGFLYNEFDKIFNEIFQKKSKVLQKIVKICSKGKVTISGVAEALKVPLNSDMSENIKILELAGFLKRDHSFLFDGKPSKYSYLRVNDNYVKFYLSQIEPVKAVIESGGKKISRWSDLKSFYNLMGYQFENLILANRTLIYSHLNLQDRDIISAAPYTQRKSTKNKGGCQIDLFIHTQLDVFYLCEIKCKKIIDATVINEVQAKMKILKIPKRSSLKPVLIYEGEVYPSHQEKLEEFFFKLIPFSELLEANE